MTVASDIQEWFREPFDQLRTNPNAGVAALLITVPLLERVLRDVTGIGEARKLTDAFFDELRVVFPDLTDTDLARRLWQALRNGLLHQVTFSKDPPKNLSPADLVIVHTESGPIIAFDSASAAFTVDPFLFAERILDFAVANVAEIERSHRPRP